MLVNNNLEAFNTFLGNSGCIPARRSDPSPRKVWESESTKTICSWSKGRTWSAYKREALSKCTKCLTKQSTLWVQNRALWVKTTRACVFVGRQAAHGKNGSQSDVADLKKSSDRNVINQDGWVLMQLPGLLWRKRVVLLLTRFLQASGFLVTPYIKTSFLASFHHFSSLQTQRTSCLLLYL